MLGCSIMNDVVIRKPTPGSKTEAILTLTATTPATPPEIAESVNCSKQLVHQVLERYGIEPNHSDSYKKCRADILAGMQEKILKEVEGADIKNASLLQKVTTVGILYDKERLERNLSTEILSTRALTIDLSKAYEAMRIARGDDRDTDTNTVDNPVDNTSCQPEVPIK